MDTSCLLELPPSLVDRVLVWLPRWTSLKLRLTCKQLDEAVSARVNSLVLPACDFLSSHRVFSERYCSVRKLTVLDSAKQADITLLLQQSPDLFSKRLDELHIHTGAGPQQAGLVALLISALGPQQQLGIHMSQAAASAALSHLQDNDCLTRLNTLSFQEPPAPLSLVPLFNQMHQLRELHYTNISPAHIAALASFSSLRKLCVGALTGQEMLFDVPAACRGLPHLTSLTLQPHRSHVHLLGTMSRPEGHLHELTQLRLLEMDGCFDSYGPHTRDFEPSAVFTAIGCLTGLSSLSLCMLSTQSMPPPDASSWSRLTRLTHVSISTGSKNGGRFLHPALANLRSVRLSGGCQCWKDPAFQPPRQLSLLTSLVVASPCDCIPWGPRWPALQHLDLCNASYASFEDLEALAALPALGTLKLNGVLLRPSSPALPLFPRLRSVSCTLHELCDEQAGSFFGAVRRVTQLSLGFGVCRVSSEAISAAFARLQAARFVEFTSKFTSVPAVGTGAPCVVNQLGAALQGLAVALVPPVLTRVSARSYAGVTVESIRLLRAFPQLECVVFLGAKVPEPLLLAARELEPAVSVRVEA